VQGGDQSVIPIACARDVSSLTINNMPRHDRNAL
jgi:hypothetical protein